MVSLKQWKLICAQAAVEQKHPPNNAQAEMVVYAKVVFNERLLLPSPQLFSPVSDIQLAAPNHPILPTEPTECAWMHK